MGKISKRSPLLLLVATAFFSTLATSVASADAVKCSKDVCLSVIGKGRYVSAVQVGTKQTDGYFFAKVRNGGSGEWVWTSWQTTNGISIFIKPLSDRTYPNGTYICAGVSSTREEKDYTNEACAQIRG
ncbi:hypothetical protein [Streptomyces zagrosensis]|uniref:Secreted protein n=1 Tax=Streptomyces zagrosensis TaxID=1042984 RepID=A0A7W9V1V3_9ACTN|nr:hypothetical protein [Streptomyces zagrosensis]MBB5939585.1 hypothetical protein [Streptomyces zagrosensis]